MTRASIVMIMSLVVCIYAINRPVYKIVLKQKGFAQFLQYDVITPPLSEFTFCTWIRVYELADDQSIFTYVVNGHRIVRLWLDSGGRLMKVSIDDKVTSSMVVEVVKDVWRHVCLSYQSDYGAWALYVDSRLVSCEAASSLHGFVMPGGGSVIIGYGTGDNGKTNGFEGEIFGANMILSSTIERNYSIKVDPNHEQKRFPRNKLKYDSKYTDYVILSDLLNDKIHNSYENTNMPHRTLTKSFHDFNNEENSAITNSMATKKPQTIGTTASHDDFDFTISDFSSTNQEKTDFWNTKINPRFTFADVYKSNVTPTVPTKLLNSATKVVPTVSEYEVPPPVPQDFYFYTTQDKKESTPPSIYSLNNTTSSFKNIYNKLPSTELIQYETPPPISENTKVYGQWTSSKFAGTVLNYLKSINFKNREQIIKRVPQTIPLHKLSDSHPYSSEFKLNILRSPPQFRNRRVVQKKYDIVRRDPQINLHILEDDLRLNILKMHAEIQPKRVEIKNHGALKQRREHPRFYRNTDYVTESKAEIDSEEPDSEDQPKQFTVKEKKQNKHRYFAQPTPGKPRTILPFLRSLDYLKQEPESSETRTENNDHDTYSKYLSQGNKWHNAKSYSNDYTPRKIVTDDSDVADYQKKIYPTLRLRYTPTKPKKKQSTENIDPSILYGRQLASEVSNQSFVPYDVVSILKYNHGDHLAEEDKSSKLRLKNEVDDRWRIQAKRNMKATNFDQHVKIGNALNEHHVIGIEEEQKKRSFLGGDENIPDINKYRSELDNENTKVPPSLGPRACKNVELYDRVLYVQPDESIDLSHILSPVREKNIAIEFVMQNYKKCSLTDSSFQRNAMLLIDWSKTPVRLFGGAYPKTTTDLCGFF